MPRVTPYRAHVYRRHRQTQAWELVAGEQNVPCDRQHRSGGMEGQPYGRVGETMTRSWVGTGRDIRRGDGFSLVERVDSAANLVATISPPENYEVVRAMDWGSPGDLELELEESGESFA